jgi:hypothetical protein
MKSIFLRVKNKKLISKDYLNNLINVIKRNSKNTLNIRSKQL